MEQRQKSVIVKENNINQLMDLNFDKKNWATIKDKTLINKFCDFVDDLVDSKDIVFKKTFTDAKCWEVMALSDEYSYPEIIPSLSKILSIKDVFVNAVGFDEYISISSNEEVLKMFENKVGLMDCIFFDGEAQFALITTPDYSLLAGEGKVIRKVLDHIGLDNCSSNFKDYADVFKEKVPPLYEKLMKIHSLYE